MNLKYIPYLVPLLTAAVISTILSIHGWRRRHSPSAIPFVFLMLFVAQWSFCYAFELGVANLQTKVLWSKIKYLGIVIVPVAWLFFTLKYSGREEWLKLKKIGLIATVPLVTLFLVWTNDLHGLIWRTSELDTSVSFSARFLTYGPWFWVHTLYSCLLLVIGTILMIQASEALNVVRDRAAEEIHLLFTDVVMPQMGGKELAERLKTMRPNTKILFTSGYPDGAIIYQGFLDPDVDFIAKPLSPSTLTRKVREVLDK